jgi:hypothetical protein
MKFGTFLLAMVQPLIAKVLLALGFSVVSIVGVEASVATLKSMVIANFGAMNGDILNLMQYAWIGHGIGIIFGAITTKLMLWSIENATKMLGKNNG